MAYFYNGAKILAPLQITSNRQTYQSETLSLKQQTFLTQAQRWELSFRIAMNSDENDMFGAHTWDFHTKKTMVMPQLNGPARALTFTGLLATADVSAGGDNTVSIAATGTGVLPAGYFIKFDNHNKIYAITDSVTFANDTQTVNVFPSLLTAVSGATAVLTGDNATIRYQLDLTSGQGITYQDGVLSDPGTIKLIESL